MENGFDKTSLENPQIPSLLVARRSQSQPASKKRMTSTEKHLNTIHSLLDECGYDVGGV